MDELIASYAAVIAKGLTSGVLEQDEGTFGCCFEGDCTKCDIVDLNSENGNLCMCSSLLDNYNATLKHQHKHEMSKFEQTYITPLLTKSHPEHFL